MVILIIQVENFSFGLVDSERDPPIVGNGEAPCSLAVAGKLMRFPARDVAELLGVFHLLQEGQNVADPLYDSRSQTGSVIMLNEAPQSPMDHVSDLHKQGYPKKCRVSSYTLQAGRDLGTLLKVSKLPPPYFLIVIVNFPNGNFDNFDLRPPGFSLTKTKL